MNTKGIKASMVALVLFCLALVPARAAMFQVPISASGGTISGSITGAYSFNGPFSTVNATNVYLNSVLTNQVMTGISKYATNQLLDIVYTNTTWVYPTDNIVTALSNAPNNSRVAIMPGNYQYTSRIVFSNSLGQGGINIFNKSNILFEAAIPGTVRIYSTNIGDGLWITNCNKVAFRGINFEGWVVTNYANTTLYVEPGVVWSAMALYENYDFEVSNCRFENFHDHGIGGNGANINWDGASTNRVRIFNNYFSNIGSARTNGSVSIDGTAIVPDGPWEITGNTFEGVLRGVEPYSDGDANVRPWSGTRIQNNTFRNVLDSAILSAGSTNANDVLIEGNTFLRDVGYTRRGSNFIASAAAIDWNGGYGWQIFNNVLVGEWTRGVYLYGNSRFGAVVDNSLISITNSGLSTGVPIDVEAGYYHRIDGNHIRNSEGQGIYIHGARDVSVRNNEVFNSAAGVGIQIASVSPIISSNIVATGNRLMGNAKGFWDMGFSDNKALHIVANDVKGATTDYDFANTAASELYLSINGGSTSNRVVRAFEVKDQINAGSNITLTTNSSGALTIAASGSGSSSNYSTLGVGSIAVTNTSSVGSVTLNGTNGIGVTIQAANSNSVPVTNIVGLLHKASAPVIVLDCNHGNRFQVTNRLGQGTTFVVTNLAQGQEVTIKGSADGTSRSVTVVPQLGFLVRDFDAFGVAAALNKAITATNGNTFEINIATAWENGTNWADVVTRQATY